MTRVSPNWLALREPADAAARSRELVVALAHVLPSDGRRVIHDLGGGTGSMCRWLAPLLTGPQHWVVHDRDVDLLALAATDVPSAAADGTPVTVQTRRTNLADVRERALAGARLITSSALLDILTADELDVLVRACAGADCPALFTLSVTGQVTITPPDPLDDRVAAAFNAHQRRPTPHGPLLGPDAVAFTVHRFREIDWDVVVARSPWRLGADQADLIAAWFAGWIDAAREQDTALAGKCEAYAHRRIARARAGRLAVTVDHADLLVVPPAAARGRASGQPR